MRFIWNTSLTTSIKLVSTCYYLESRSAIAINESVIHSNLPNITIVTTKEHVVLKSFAMLT